MFVRFRNLLAPTSAMLAAVGLAALLIAVPASATLRK